MASVDDAGAALAAMFKQRRRATLRLAVAGATAVFGATLAIPGAFLVCQYGSITAAYGCALYAALAVTATAIALGGTADETAAARRLARIGDVRAVGPLLEYVDIHGYAEAPEARLALADLLPRLRPGEGALTPRQYELLARRLYDETDPEVLVALLQAFRYVGGTSSRHRIRMLAAGLVPWITDPRVQAQATESLPFVLARLEAEWRGSPLLRPSAEPAERLLPRSALNPGSDTDSQPRAAATYISGLQIKNTNVEPTKEL